MSIDIVERDLYSIKMDPEKHRLYLKFNGFWVSAERVPFLFNDMKEALEMMARTKFTALIDLREFRPPLPEVAHLHVELQKLMKDYGLIHNAGIYSEIHQKIALKRYCEAADMTINFFKTVEDADSWLDVRTRKEKPLVNEPVN